MLKASTSESKKRIETSRAVAAREPQEELQLRRSRRLRSGQSNGLRLLIVRGASVGRVVRYLSP